MSLLDRAQFGDEFLMHANSIGCTGIPKPYERVRERDGRAKLEFGDTNLSFLKLALINQIGHDSDE